MPSKHFWTNYKAKNLVQVSNYHKVSILSNMCPRSGDWWILHTRYPMNGWRRCHVISVISICRILANLLFVQGLILDHLREDKYSKAIFHSCLVSVRLKHNVKNKSSLAMLTILDQHLEHQLNIEPPDFLSQRLLLKPPAWIIIYLTSALAFCPTPVFVQMRIWIHKGTFTARLLLSLG